MKICIDTDLLQKKYKFSLEEFLLMLLIKNCSDINSVYESLSHVGAITNSIFDNRVILTNKYSQLIDTILIKSDKYIPDTSRIENLAKQMRELFPKGFKAGSVSWRGTLKEVTESLSKFFSIYGNDYTDEQILEATRKYLEIHNNDDKARCAKYFIMKNIDDINSEGKVCKKRISDLAEMLENEDSEIETDWTAELR